MRGMRQENLAKRLPRSEGRVPGCSRGGKSQEVLPQGPNFGCRSRTVRDARTAIRGRSTTYVVTRERRSVGRTTSLVVGRK